MPDQRSAEDGAGRSATPGRAPEPARARSGRSRRVLRVRSGSLRVRESRRPGRGRPSGSETRGSTRVRPGQAAEQESRADDEDERRAPPPTTNSARAKRAGAAARGRAAAAVLEQRAWRSRPRRLRAAGARPKSRPGRDRGGEREEQDDRVDATSRRGVESSAGAEAHQRRRWPTIASSRPSAPPRRARSARSRSASCAQRCGPGPRRCAARIASSLLAGRRPRQRAGGRRWRRPCRSTSAHRREQRPERRSKLGRRGSRNRGMIDGASGRCWCSGYCRFEPDA